MQKTTLKSFLILILVVGILSLTGVFLTSQVSSQNSEPTETPTPYWMAYPPQKRAYFETQEAGRIEALKSPEPPPPPTFPPETEEPIILDGKKAGAGFLFDGPPAPVSYQTYDLDFTIWAFQEGDQTYGIYVGRNKGNDEGIVIVITQPTDGSRGITNMEFYRAPGKSGKLKIDGADGKKLKLKSDKGKKLKFDADTRQFEQDQ